jgi:hypothetical protein
METAPAVADQPRSPLGTLGTGALRLPDLLLGALRALALEIIVVLGVGAIVGLLSFFFRGTPRIFADFWTAGTYLSFAVGAPLAAQTLLDDLRCPDLLDWWPGGVGSRTRLRMPSTALPYLVVDAIPIVVAALLLREPQARSPIGYLLGAVTLVVCGGTAGLRLWSRRRHGPTARPDEEAASVEEPPQGGRVIAAVVLMVVPLVGLVAVLAALHAGLATWVAAGALYLVGAAALKGALVGRRVLVAPPAPEPAPRKRRRR